MGVRAPLTMPETGEAAWLMDRDAAHLDATASDGRTRVAVYHFAGPSVTAGRNAEVAQDAIERWRSHGHAYARRPTGGGVLRHDPADLAFGVAFACGQGFAGDYLRLVSDGIRGALDAQGIVTTLPAAGGDQPACCFQRALGWELQRQGEKLVGLAARRVRGAVLVQGALVVRRDAALDELLIGVGPRVDLADVPFDPGAWTEAFQGAMMRGPARP